MPATTRKPGDRPGIGRKSDTKTTDGVFRWGKPGSLVARKPSDDAPLHSKDPKGTDMKKILAVATATLAATPALAHHPLGGMPMETFAHGALSGVGHPVLGFDHMFFVIAMGIAALFTAHRYLTPAAYIVAMLVGCGLMYAGVALPLTETFIAISLLAIGGVVLSGRALGTGAALALFAAFGLFHGSAFGSSIAGQEGGISAAVLTGYLLGLGLIQFAIAIAAGWVGEKLLGATEAASVNARLAGAMVAGVGVFLCLEILEGPLVAAIGG